MAGWATRKAKEAAERAERDAAMKIVGAAEERIRIREELLAEFGGRALFVDSLRSALDKICPVNTA